MIPLPQKKNNALEHYKKLHMNQRMRLKKELKSKAVPGEMAVARNKLMYIQELNNLINDKQRVHNILGKGSLPYRSIDQDHKREEQLNKLISL